MELSKYEQDSIIKFGKSVMDGKWSNEGLVQLFKAIGEDFLNIKSIQKFRKDNDMSYNGVKYFRDVRSVNGIKFVIDNE